MESDASCIRLSSLCVLCTDSSRVASGQGKTLHEGKLTSVSFGHDQSILCEVSYTESRRDVAEEQLWDYRMYHDMFLNYSLSRGMAFKSSPPLYSIRGTPSRRYAGLDAAQETLQAAFYFAHRNQLEGRWRKACSNRPLRQAHPSRYSTTRAGPQSAVWTCVHPHFSCLSLLPVLTLE